MTKYFGLKNYKIWLHALNPQKNKIFLGFRKSRRDFFQFIFGKFN